MRRICRLLVDVVVVVVAVALGAGTKIAYYFAWLQFYTLALVFPTVVGLVVWWKERIPDGVQDTVCAPGTFTLMCVFVYRVLFVCLCV